MAQQNSAIHLFAGGMGGTAGAIATCPLEVVKTRLQSSTASFSMVTLNQQPSAFTSQSVIQTQKTMGLYSCLKHIVEHEGVRALWKGLGPNLVGVAPSRAIYFYAYANAKAFFETRFNRKDSSLVHMSSAFCAGFTASTLTNPIWLVKTRVQLDRSRAATGSKFTVVQCVRVVYGESGLKGFYKGITASYYGISETVVHFVIYEALKKRILTRNRELEGRNPDQTKLKDYVMFMGAAACSKTSASMICYPHEVARTRLREPGMKYRHFWQTLQTVVYEEGIKGIYRGLGTQLVRQIPNTAIMMATYEGIVYLLGGRTQGSEIPKKFRKKPKADQELHQAFPSRDSYQPNSSGNSRCSLTVSEPPTQYSPKAYSSLAISASAGPLNGLITVTDTSVLRNKTEEGGNQSDLDDELCEDDDDEEDDLEDDDDY